MIAHHAATAVHSGVRLKHAATAVISGCFLKLFGHPNHLLAVIDVPDGFGLQPKKLATPVCGNNKLLQSRHPQRIESAFFSEPLLVESYLGVRESQGFFRDCGSVVRLLEIGLLRSEDGLQVTNLLLMGGQPLLLRRVLEAAAVLANV